MIVLWIWKELRSFWITKGMYTHPIYSLWTSMAYMRRFPVINLLFTNFTKMKMCLEHCVPCRDTLFITSYNAGPDTTSLWIFIRGPDYLRALHGNWYSTYLHWLLVMVVENKGYYIDFYHFLVIVLNVSFSDVSRSDSVSPRHGKIAYFFWWIIRWGISILL